MKWPFSAPFNPFRMGRVAFKAITIQAVKSRKGNSGSRLTQISGCKHTGCISNTPTTAYIWAPYLSKFFIIFSKHCISSVWSLGDNTDTHTCPPHHLQANCGASSSGRSQESHEIFNKAIMCRQMNKHQRNCLILFITHNTKLRIWQ